MWLFPLAAVVISAQAGTLGRHRGWRQSSYIGVPPATRTGIRTYATPTGSEASSILAGAGAKAASITSSAFSTNTKFNSSLSSFVRSSKSFSLRLGKMIVLMPARCAPNIFSFTPPTGITLPRSVISPVIARSERTNRSVKSDTSATVNVIPAEGPSFGTAPAGTCMCMSFRSKNRGLIPKRSACDLT